MFSLVAAIFAVGALAGGAERSDLRIARPDSLIQRYPNGIVETPALFGIPAVGHGASISGEVVYSIPQDLDGCDPIDQTQAHKLWPQSGIVILLVDRGNCTFVTKVQHAQDAGAHACIVVDNKDEPGLPYMADDGKGGVITIPSLLIHKDDGQAIKDVLLQDIVVEVTLSWNMPSPDNRVEWSLWTSSDDQASVGFKSQFGTVVRALGDHAVFQPHYSFIKGEDNGCFPNDGSQPCGNQCTNQGRYCAMDPERDMESGLDGAHVVRENVRQMCVFQVANATGEPAKWWDYVVKFQVDCTVNKEVSWTEQCARTSMTAVGLVADDVMACVVDAGDVGDDSGVNVMMEAEMELYSELGAIVFFLPTVLVNDVPYRGGLSCSSPETSQCGVLKTICAGYADDTEPDACSTDPGCEIGEKWDNCKQCNGRGQDFCGLCYSATDPRWVDPSVGGTDECGACMATTDPSWNKSCMGCDGVTPNGPDRDFCGNCYPAGDARFVSPEKGGIDECAKCMATDSPLWNKSCMGCDGETVNGPDRDFCGNCYPAGDPRIVTAAEGITDACGKCLKKTDPQVNMTCLGCDGLPNGPARDACGRCLAEGDPERVEIGSNCPADKLNNKVTVIPVWSIILIAAVSVIIIGLGVYCYMRKKQNAMREDIDSLLKEYLPLDASSIQQETR